MSMPLFFSNERGTWLKPKGLGPPAGKARVRRGTLLDILLGAQVWLVWPHSFWQLTAQGAGNHTTWGRSSCRSCVSGPAGGGKAGHCYPTEEPSRLFLDVAAWVCGQTQMLLSRGDAPPCLGLWLWHSQCISGLDLEDDGLACQGLHKDLYLFICSATLLKRKSMPHFCLFIIWGMVVLFPVWGCY